MCMYNCSLVTKLKSLRKWCVETEFGFVGKHLNTCDYVRAMKINSKNCYYVIWVELTGKSYSCVYVWATEMECHQTMACFNWCLLPVQSSSKLGHFHTYFHNFHPFTCIVCWNISTIGKIHRPKWMVCRCVTYTFCTMFG